MMTEQCRSPCGEAPGITRDAPRCLGCKKQTGRSDDICIRMNHVPVTCQDVKPFICSSCGKCLSPHSETCSTFKDSSPKDGTCTDAAANSNLENTNLSVGIDLPSICGKHTQSTFATNHRRSEDHNLPFDHQSEHEEACDSKAWFRRDSLGASLEGGQEIPGPSAESNQWQDEDEDLCQHSISTFQHFLEDRGTDVKSPRCLGNEHFFPGRNQNQNLLEKCELLLQTANDKHGGNDLAYNGCDVVNETKDHLRGETFRLSEYLPDFDPGEENTHHGAINEIPSRPTGVTAEPSNCNTDSESACSSDSSTNHAEMNPMFQSSKQRFKCDTCGTSSSSKSCLERHKIQHPSERPYQCEECGKGFAQKYKLKNHKYVHTRERPFKCKICGKGLLAKQSLDYHMSHVHAPVHPANPRSCDKCGERFTEKSKPENHKCASTSEQSYKGGMCGQKILAKTTFNSHIRTHENTKRHECDECGMGFSKQKKLELHKCAVRTGELTYTCDKCGKGFLIKQQLDHHVHTHHCNKKTYRCDECGKTFGKLYHLSRHKMTHSKIKPHLCDTCGKGFVSRSDLLKHVRVHTGERPYACDECDKAYTQSCGLTKHKHEKHYSSATHYHREGKTRFCKDCGKGFASDAHLRVHKFVHTGEKPHQCEVCTRRFAHSHHLTRHKLIHTGEKPHECWVCGDKFRYCTEMTIHIRTHTGEKPYDCTQCDESFISTFLLRGHIAKCHVDSHRSDAAKCIRNRKRKHEDERDAVEREREDELYAEEREHHGDEEREREAEREAERERDGEEREREAEREQDGEERECDEREREAEDGHDFVEREREAEDGHDFVEREREDERDGQKRECKAERDAEEREDEPDVEERERGDQHNAEEREREAEDEHNYEERKREERDRENERDAEERECKAGRDAEEREREDQHKAEEREREDQHYAEERDRENERDAEKREREDEREDP